MPPTRACKEGLSLSTFKHELASVKGRTVGNMQQQSPTSVRERLVGSANEATVHIEGIQCSALLDTGSTVSTVSQEFYEQHLKANIPMHPVKEMLKIECAGGDFLPYLGYIEAEVGGPDLPVQAAIFLITPCTDYSSQVPVLLGTNVLKAVLEQCEARHGKQFLQRMNLSTAWWLAFRCICIRERERFRSPEVR